MRSRLLVQYPMKTVSTVLVLMALGSSPAYGADIYRWVDEDGRVHFSDTVPQQHKKSATSIDSRQYELSPEQRKEAEARAAREKERSEEIAKQKAAEAATPTKSTPKAGTAAAKPPAPATDCATLLQRFRESSECYAPFFNVNGSIKNNAYETCGPAVRYPAQECS